METHTFGEIYGSEVDFMRHVEWRESVGNNLYKATPDWIDDLTVLVSVGDSDTYLMKRDTANAVELLRSYSTTNKKNPELVDKVPHLVGLVNECYEVLGVPKSVSAETFGIHIGEVQNKKAQKAKLQLEYIADDIAQAMGKW